MEVLISFYDNALIYYPNVFFAVIIAAGILVLVLIIKLIFLLGKKVRIALKEVSSDLRQIKRIKPQKINIKKFYPAKAITNLLKFVIKIITIVLASVGTFSTYIESNIRIIIKKIEKEIFIKE